MTKKFIGVDYDQQTLRVATATLVKGVPVLTGIREEILAATEDGPAVLAGAIGEIAFGDRIAACLNAVGSYYRLLAFPFGEPKKIEPAVELELSSQLPTSDELVSDFLTPHPVENDFEVPAAAVRRTAVIDMLGVFHRAEVPLHQVDLNPFAYAAGLAEAVPEGVLAVVHAGEITVSHVREGQVLSFRAMPLRPQDESARLAVLVHRDYLALVTASGEDRLPLYLIGEGAGEELQKALKELECEPLVPVLKMDGRPIAPALLPAAALAMRAARTGRHRQFNFLKKDLAPKSEWAGFRLRLIALAALTGLSIILAVSGAYLNYEQKQKRAELLRQETIAIFRQTFPQIQTIVDVPSQMRGSLEELRQRAQLLGVGRNRSALNLLRELSARLPAELAFEVRELNFNGEQVKIDGTTSSFEAINRLSQAFDESPLFEQSQIADAKMALDGGRVEFRLNLKISAEELVQ